MPLRVLSLNLCTMMWGHPRKERLQTVADFVKANDIDVILAQEGLRSCYPIYDSIRQLAGMLDYEYFARTPWGWPWFAESRVAVISLYKIIRTASLDCEVPQTEWADAIPIPWRKRAVAATVDVPDLGITTLVSVHLTSSPKTEAGRASQFLKLHGWISGLPPADVWICGGDFNCTHENPAFMGVFGATNIAGQTPDYITVDGAKIVKEYQVLTGQNVTDHAGGAVAEVEKA